MGGGGGGWEGILAKESASCITHHTPFPCAHLGVKVWGWGLGIEGYLPWTEGWRNLSQSNTLYLVLAWFFLGGGYGASLT